MSQEVLDVIEQIKRLMPTTIVQAVGMTIRGGAAVPYVGQIDTHSLSMVGHQYSCMEGCLLAAKHALEDIASNEPISDTPTKRLALEALERIKAIQQGPIKGW